MPHSMHELAIPTKPGLIEALGRLAIAHTHLELILRYTVKTLSELSVTEALDATNRNRISDVRNKIKRLFKEKKPLPSEEVQLDALLGESTRLSQERNDYLHSAWSETESGEALLKQENYQWGPAPSQSEVDHIASSILQLGRKINDARLHGFISQVVKRHKEKSIPRLRSSPDGE